MPGDHELRDKTGQITCSPSAPDGAGRSSPQSRARCCCRRDDPWLAWSYGSRSPYWPPARPLGGFGLEPRRCSAEAHRPGSPRRWQHRPRRRPSALAPWRALRGQSEPGGDPVQSDLRARGRPRHRPRFAAATVAMPFAEPPAQVAGGGGGRMCSVARTERRCLEHRRPGREAVRRVAPCRRHRPGAAAGADAVAASVGRRRVRAAAGAGGGASRSADQDSHRLAAARLGVRDV